MNDINLPRRRSCFFAVWEALIQLKTVNENKSVESMVAKRITVDSCIMTNLQKLRSQKPGQKERTSPATLSPSED